MYKKAKPIFYVAAIVVILTAVILVMISINFSKAPVLPEAFTAIEGAQANSYAVNFDILERSEVDVLLGSKKANLNILVYEDYANIFSAQLAQTLKQIEGEFNGQVAITIRPFVMPGSVASQEAALAYLCSQDYGKGEEMRLKLWEALQVDSEKTIDMVNIIQDLKLNENRFLSCLASQEKMLVLENIKKDAKKNLILGAPTLVIGDEMILGARPYGDFVDSNGDVIEGLKTIVERKLIEALASK